MRPFSYVLIGVLVVGLGGCTEPLVVSNSNNPDRDKALASATDLESFLGATYAIVHSGTLGGALTDQSGDPNDGLQPQLLVMGMENVSGLANNAMGPRSGIPRNPIDNQPGSQGNAGNFRDFVVENRAARLATLALARLQTLGTLGDPGRDARFRAFAKFVQGVGLGNLALAYDSASILTEGNTNDAFVPLSGYKDVMAAALADLDDAITIALSPEGQAGFPLPSNWINGDPLSADEFIQFVHSYKARLRAGVARNPTERAAVDWNAVITDVDGGITSDFNVTMSPANGWDVVWVGQQYATGSASWHQMSQFFLGMADKSGAYDTWLGDAMTTCTAGNRCPFLVVTDDQRFPQGATRAAQNLDGPPVDFSSTHYFRNRPSGEDIGQDPLQESMYDSYRSRAFFLANDNGPYPIMTAAEIRLLKAEALLRTGDAPGAAALIDVSRIAKGALPSLGAVTDSLAVVPGGAACVPKVPDEAATPKAFAKSRCGRVWDALKWEYRMETAYTGYGMWYFAARGWGDLPEGTAVSWAVPFQELQVRGQGIYGLGGSCPDKPGGSGPGNYGLRNGGLYSCP